jgi:hypothetical protein
MSEQTGQATIAELAESARKHYAEVSIEALSWYSLIPDAIDAWEREQTRLRRPSLLARLHGLLCQLWAGSAALTCPENYAGGGWVAGACEGCRAQGCCRETVLLP